jgi:hypothetical protein
VLIIIINYADNSKFSTSPPSNAAFQVKMGNNSNSAAVLGDSTDPGALGQRQGHQQEHQESLPAKSWTSAWTSGSNLSGLSGVSSSSSGRRRRKNSNHRTTRDKALDSLLIDAAEGGFLGEVMRLVDLGADVDATDIKVSYVCKGATRNCIYTSVLIYDHVIIQGRSPLIAASFLGFSKMVDYLISVDADVNKLNNVCGFQLYDVIAQATGYVFIFVSMIGRQFSIILGLLHGSLLDSRDVDRPWRRHYREE